jgi:hypothetical protein
MARVELNVQVPDFIPLQSASHYGHSMSDIPENKEIINLTETQLSK